MSARYDELRHLLSSGVPLEDALRRCGIPSAEAAARWAYRHGDEWLLARVRHACEVERYAREKLNAQRRRATA